MLLSSLLVTPIIGIFLIFSTVSYNINKLKTIYLKKIALFSSIVNLFISFIIYMSFDLSNNQFQFVQEHYNSNIFNIYLSIDGISIYFVLLTTIIVPIALVSN
jgi:NADH-ubiquinone oxidoreductase chain 4